MREITDSNGKRFHKHQRVYIYVPRQMSRDLPNVVTGIITGFVSCDLIEVQMEGRKRVFETCHVVD